MKIVGVKAEMNRIKSHVRGFEKDAVATMRNAAIVVLKQLFSRTPVWSGETVRNYAVGVGSMPAGGSKGSLGGDPGPTSEQRLGEENNRPVNESAALSDAQSALGTMTRLKSVFITNLVDADKWGLVDSGSAPDKNRARNPGGVSKIAELNAKAILSGKFD